MIVKVRCMKDFVDLPFKSIIVTGIVVSQRIDGYAGHKIKVFLAFCIPDTDSLSTLYGERVTIVCVKYKLIDSLHDFILCHKCTCYLSFYLNLFPTS